MTGLQITSLQSFWKIKNSMLQFRKRHSAYLPKATNCQWGFAIGYQVNRRKLTQVFLCAKFTFDIELERVNIATVDTDVAILGVYFQSMLHG